MGKINEFTDLVLEQFSKEMTDIIFSYIENDRKLLKEYLDTVAEAGDLRTVNNNIAKAVRDMYNLKTTDNIQQQPKSKLIQSYTEFKNK